MNIQFAPDNTPQRRVKIKVVGVGGAGGNAVDRMIANGLSEVDFYAVNTDGQALDRSRAHQTLVIGNELTRGLGAGGDPQIGRRAAEEDREVLAAMVEDADMVFVTAGMGGGTGTGAAPVVAEVARASGALTVAVVTRPFLFEGFRRMEQAEAGLAALREHTDALLVIPNERLMEIDLPDGAMTEVFGIADNVLYEATRGISDIIAQHAVVNLDFADVRTVMQDSGAAIMGTGRAAGDDRATLAAEKAINSPLLENVDIHGSRAVLVYLAAGNVGRDDLRGAMGYIQQAAGAEAHVFFGFANDESLGEDLQVTVIATGFPAGQQRPQAGPTRAVAAGDPGAGDPPLADAEAPARNLPSPEAAMDDDGAPDREAAASARAAAAAHEPMTAADDPPAQPSPERPATADAGPPDGVSPAATEPAGRDQQPRPAVETGPDCGPVAGSVPQPEPELQPDPEPEPMPETGPSWESEPQAGSMPPFTAESSIPEQPRQQAGESEAARNLAALAAAAGGAARTVEMPPQAPPPGEPASAADSGAWPATPPPAASSPAAPSETSRRFLDPVGAVPLEDDGTSAPPPAGPRFRSSVLGDDKLRPAWERKYVD